MNDVETPTTYQLQKLAHAKSLARKHNLVISDQETYWIVYRRINEHKVLKIGRAQTIDSLVALLYKASRTADYVGPDRRKPERKK